MCCWHLPILSLRQVQKPLSAENQLDSLAGSMQPPSTYFCFCPLSPEFVSSLPWALPFPCCLVFLDSSVSLTSHEAALMVPVLSQSIVGLLQSRWPQPPALCGKHDSDTEYTVGSQCCCLLSEVWDKGKLPFPTHRGRKNLDLFLQTLALHYMTRVIWPCCVPTCWSIQS